MRSTIGAGSDTVGSSSVPGGRFGSSSGYIHGLDGLRAICVSLVMLGHFGFGRIVPGGLGVTVFFFISGYLITTLLLHESVVHGKISLTNFYARRFLRLAPELMLLITFGLAVGLLYQPVRLADLVGAVTYLTNYFIIYDQIHGNIGQRWPHLWSLAVEEHFYLLFPIVVVFFSRAPRLLLFFIVLTCGSVLFWRLTIVHFGAPLGFAELGAAHPYTYIATDTRIDSIGFGCATAVLLQLWSGHLDRGTSWVFFVTSVGIMLISLLIRSESFRESWRYSLQGLSTALFFVTLFRSVVGLKIAEVLEFPILRSMGALSYGAYLWHLEVALVFHRITGLDPVQATLLQRILLSALGFAIAFGMAKVSFEISAPIRRLRARLHAAANGNVN